MTEPNSYYSRLTAAFVRGHSQVSGTPVLAADLLHIPLADLTASQQAELIAAGLAAEFPLHPFKRTMPLPRVTWALGVLRGIQPLSLLDIGSGRGTFLWPLLDTFPALPVTAGHRRRTTLSTSTLGNIPETVDVAQSRPAGAFEQKVTVTGSNVLRTIRHIRLRHPPFPDILSCIR
jgi:hypothetical protein